MLVYKFGGSYLTSNSNYAKIFRLVKRKIKKDKVIIVVSAIGRNDAFSTNTLLKDASYLSPYEKDAFLSLGEQYSSLKLTNYLLQKGINTHCILANELDLNVDDNYYIDSDSYLNFFKDYDCLIVPGFFGKNRFGYLRNLGRGGSDLSAVLIAKSLGLKDVYLNKDTKGVYSCNDDIIENKITLKNLSFDQAINYFTYSGEVVQLKALEMAKEYNIRIHITNLDSRFETLISDIKNEWCIYGIVNIDDKIYIFGKTDDYTLEVIKRFLKEYEIISLIVRVGFIEVKVNRNHVETLFSDIHKKFIEN